MASKYIVVKFGDLIRDETMNIGVITYGDGVFCSQFLKNWDRIRAAFKSPQMLIDNALSRLNDIKTEEQLKAVMERTGPYTPFEFAEPRPSLDSAESTLRWAAKFFLIEDGVKNAP